MKSFTKKLMTFGFLSVSAMTAYAAGWGYTGNTGPENWYKLDPNNALCKDGKNQTPINIVPDYDVALTPISLNHKTPAKTITNNGHSIEVQFPEGNSMSVDGMVFELKQVHFHAPSENHLMGKSYPFEAHFVHKDKNGTLAVLAVFYEEGKKNSDIAALWEVMPRSAGKVNTLPKGFVPSSLLPAKMDHTYFNGSLTTPPCTEGVRWYVLKEVQSIGKDQVKAFADVMKHPNNRPLQPVNARKVLD